LTSKESAFCKLASVFMCVTPYLHEQRRGICSIMWHIKLPVM